MLRVVAFAKISIICLDCSLNQQSYRQQQFDILTKRNKQTIYFGFTVYLFKALFFFHWSRMYVCVYVSNIRRLTFICVFVYNHIQNSPNEKTIKKIIFGVGRFDNFIAFLRQHDSVIFTWFGFSFGCLCLYNAIISCHQIILSCAMYIFYSR